MATETMKRSKILAEIRDDIRALPDFGSESYDEAVLEVRRKIKENVKLISSFDSAFKDHWHEIRTAIYWKSEDLVPLLSYLADTLDKVISNEIKSEAQAFSYNLSERIKSFSSEAVELMNHISDIHPKDVAQLSPEISCTLSEIASQIDELLRLVDAI